MGEALRLGLIGVGGISQRAHIPAWKMLPDVKVVAIAEPNAANRRRGVDLLVGSGPDQVAAFESYEEMFAHVALDAVDITIQPGPAKEAAIEAALAAGCHVTCQKPFTREYEKAVELARKAAKSERILSVNQQARYAGAFAELRKWIDDGRLGSLRTIQLYADFQNVGHDQWLLYSVHSFDLIRFWAGREPRRVMAFHKAQTDDPRYLFSVLLDFDGELVAHIWDEMSSSTTLRWGFRVMGDRGTARGHESFLASMIPQEIVYTPAGSSEESILPIARPYVPDAFAGYFRSFVQAIRGEGPVPTSAEDNLKTLRLAFAARESARTGRWVEIQQ